MAFSNSFPSILSTSESEIDHLTSAVTSTITSSSKSQDPSQSPSQRLQLQLQSPVSVVGSKNKWASVPTLTSASQSDTPEQLSLLHDRVRVDIDYNSQYGSSGSGFDGNDPHLPLDDPDPDPENSDSDNLFRFCSVTKQKLEDENEDETEQVEFKREAESSSHPPHEFKLQDIDSLLICEEEDEELVREPERARQLVLDGETLIDTSWSSEPKTPQIQTKIPIRNHTQSSSEGQGNPLSSRRISSDMEIQMQDSTRETFHVSPHCPNNPKTLTNFASGTTGGTTTTTTTVRCDLLSQLEENNKNQVQGGGPRENSLVDIDSCPSTTTDGCQSEKSTTSTVDQDENPIEADMLSSFDDNGNPWNLDGDPANPLKPPLLPDKPEEQQEQEEEEQDSEQTDNVGATGNKREVVKDASQQEDLIHFHSGATPAQLQRSISSSASTEALLKSGGEPLSETRSSGNKQRDEMHEQQPSISSPGSGSQDYSLGKMNEDSGKSEMSESEPTECAAIKLGFKVLQKSVEGFMDEPKYFINAAALSDDLEAFTMPSLESDTGLDDEIDMSLINRSSASNTLTNSTSNSNSAKLGDGTGNKCDKWDSGSGGLSGNQRKEHEHPQSPSSTQFVNVHELMRDKKSVPVPIPYNPSSQPPPTVMVKPRVPMSKSFPDIIQTTFVDDRCEFKTKKLLKAETLMEKETSYSDLAADSLEELPLTDQLAAKEFQYPQKQQQHHQHHHQQQQQQQSILSSNAQFDFKSDAELEDIMEMSQSQSQIGILAEKPPEAWVIDFNSLSLDSEAFDSHSEMSSSIKSSNPNSLAFFIDIDDNSAAEQQGKNKHNNPNNKSPDKKKIFSMFVDFGENEKAQQQQQQQQEQLRLLQQQQTHQQHPPPSQVMPQQHVTHPNLCASVKPSRLPIHRNLMSVLKDEDGPIPSVGPYNPSTGNCTGSPTTTTATTTTGMGNKGAAQSNHGHHLSSKAKRTFQYPSPILQHKVAAEAARKAAASKIELLEATEKSKEGPEETTTANTPGSIPSNINIDTSTTSNRSSLHVATDFDMMTFSSSFISSMEASAPTVEELCSKGPCFKLGKDLLRMFQDGINTDVNICVNGRYLKAHKCILSSRSQYFAAIFSGQLIEKAGNTITLDGFSFNVVHFTMCHIYSGTNEIPDSIDLLELATLTDLLGLEGLRENISQTIRVKFCHNFHRPCTGCIAGVLECFHIAVSYEMDELHRKMTKWICKHFVRIWPTKAFANLGDDMVEKCLRYSVNHLSVDNILDITLGCDQLLTTMPSVRWTEPVFAIVNQLSEACVLFIGEHFSQVLQCQRFLLFGKGQQWNISRIEGTFTESMALIKPDEACLSHTALSRLIELGTETIDEVEWSTMFVDFLKMLAKEIERFLIANASKAVLSKYWEHLGQDVRKRICTTSFLAYDKAGNKIVKGNATTAGPKQQNPGRLTPSERTSSISSIKSGTSSSKSSNRHHAEHNKSSSPNFGHGNYSSKSNMPNAKIASVRPIQNVFSTAVEPTEIIETAPAPTKPTSGNHSSSSSKPSSGSHRAQPTQLTRRKHEDKEKSFTNSPRNSVASSSLASANRTPLNPLTPITPSKPPPSGMGCGISTTTTRAKRATTPGIGNGPKNSTTIHAVATTAVAAKSAFVTNSARANAVSKPVLRQKNVTPTSNNKSSINTPRTPNLSQPSRYASSLGVAGHNRNARGSFSGSEKSEKLSITATGANEAKGTRGRVSSMSSTSSSAATHSRGRSNREKVISKHSTGGSGGNTSASNSSSRQTSAKSSSGFGTGSGAGPDSMRDSTNMMSRSTIDTDSGETKMRTLAEIGRSSTFSKDEPTILGKLDPTHTMSIDFS